MLANGRIRQSLDCSCYTRNYIWKCHMQMTYYFPSLLRVSDFSLCCQFVVMILNYYYSVLFVPGTRYITLHCYRFTPLTNTQHGGSGGVWTHASEETGASCATGGLVIRTSGSWVFSGGGGLVGAAGSCWTLLVGQVALRKCFLDRRSSAPLSVTTL